jgi:NitT/TauT family transport system substrate-binding protein
MTKAAAAGLVIAAVLIAGCASSPSRRHVNATTADLVGSAGAVRNTENGQVLRLGYPDDLDSAPALAAIQLGLYHRDMATVTLEPEGYQSYLDEINALEHGQLDAAYLDPIAAVSAWQFTGAGYLHIIAGATTGISELIARPQVTLPSELRGTRVEAPADSSQAAALDAWLARNHLAGHVQVDGSPLTTVGILQQFKAGVVTAAWEAPPLAQQLAAAGGHVLATQGGPTAYGQADLVGCSWTVNGQLQTVTPMSRGFPASERAARAEPYRAG